MRSAPIPQEQHCARQVGGTSLLGRFVKFCIVGGSGVFVDMGVLYLMSDRNSFGFSVIIGKLCAGTAAMVNNFFWNEVWTFSRCGFGRSSAWLGGVMTLLDGERAHGSALIRRFVMFTLISGTGVLIAAALLHFMYTRLQWNLYLGNLIAVTLVALWNFGMNAKFNWKVRELNH